METRYIFYTYRCVHYDDMDTRSARGTSPNCGESTTNSNVARGKGVTGPYTRLVRIIWTLQYLVYPSDGPQGPFHPDLTRRWLTRPPLQPRRDLQKAKAEVPSLPFHLKNCKGISYRLQGGLKFMLLSPVKPRHGSQGCLDTSLT